MLMVVIRRDRMNKIKNLSVIGAGLMGHGIALKFAQAGTNVIVHDNNKEVLSSLIDRIRQSYSQMGVSENEIEIFIKNINISDDLNYSVKKADLVIEAVSEKLELKQEIFFEVEKTSPPLFQIHSKDCCI